ncbi:hypothetical protein ONZ45_g10497 [Pleurotus djamor]|nr:hypothetical protein ONZ45_g10497 [Pleurotus djamor]
MPRLRLSRNTQYTQSDPVPGPSRLVDQHPDLSGIDEHDEASDSTPKLVNDALLFPNEQAITPAARLRALIASSTPRPTTHFEPPPKSPSLLESDFELPPADVEKSRIANVKQIFSAALRESPQKSRRRRSSIDGSEVEGSPVKSASVRDKGKRKVASDEEITRPPSSSSQAASFSMLREKLENSRTPSKNIPLSRLFDMDNDSQDTASLLRELNQSTPPFATSTPQRSLQMPLFASQTSNLLEADSEMNRAMEASSTLDPLHEPENSSEVTRPAVDEFSKTLKRHSADFHGLSKQHSLKRSPSNPTNTSRRVSDGHVDRVGLPDLKHRRSQGSISSVGSHSPLLSPAWPPRRSLSRQSSASSLQSQDDDFSSRASSVSSQAEYRDRIRQQELERNYDLWATTTSHDLVPKAQPLVLHLHYRSTLPTDSVNDSPFRRLLLALRIGTPPGSPSRRRDDLRASTPHSPLAPIFHETNRPISPSPAQSKLSHRRSIDFSNRLGSSTPSLRPTRLKENLSHSSPTAIPRSVSPMPRSHSPLPPISVSPAPSLTPGPRPPSRTGQSSRIPVRLKPTVSTEQREPEIHAERVSDVNTAPSPLEPAISHVPLTPDPADSTSHLNIPGAEETSSGDATPLSRPLKLPREDTAVQQIESAQAPSPPLTPSEDSLDEATPHVSVLSTPPRQHSSRIEFKTPPPPVGLPDLPGPPPSSDEETDLEGNIETRAGGLSLMKTPKPPGSWADTPAPEKPRFLSNSSDPVASDQDIGLATPGPSLSRGSSLPLQTPAPPGGWLATPAPRKSILKVRFDPQSESFPASSQDEYSGADVSDLPVKSNPSLTASEVPRNGLVSLDRDAPASNDDEEPPSRINRTRRVPTIHMLDAYGREIIDTPTPDLDSIEMVDVMGPNVEDAVDDSLASADDSSLLDHNEALNRVRLGLSHLAHDMSDADRSMELTADPLRLQQLDSVSRAARETRETIAHSLTLARTSSEEMRNRFAPMREYTRLKNNTSPSLGKKVRTLLWYGVSVFGCLAVVALITLR